MILFWMRHSLMTHVIIQENFLKVTGEQHIHQTNQAVGCQLSREQANSFIPWTQTKGQVFICDLCIAQRLSMQLYSAQVQLDRIYPRCITSLNLIIAGLVHDQWGNNLENTDISQFKPTTWNNSIAVYSECLLQQRGFLLPEPHSNPLFNSDVQHIVFWQGKVLYTAWDFVWTKQMEWKAMLHSAAE